MSRILIVDDEPAILRLLGVILSRDRHEAVPVGDARAALAETARGHIDAAMIDLGLPDRDGLELVQAIRKDSSVPIIVVTARSDVSEKIAALDLGADDYITKPFDGDELLARLRSALRRAGGRILPDDELVFGPIRIDPGHRKVTVDGREITLTPREFSVLQALVEAKGRILTHAALLGDVWGKAHLHDVEYLRVVIRALRLKIEQDPSSPVLILNEPGIGYRLKD